MLLVITGAAWTKLRGMIGSYFIVSAIFLKTNRNNKKTLLLIKQINQLYLTCLSWWLQNDQICYNTQRAA